MPSAKPRSLAQLYWSVIGTTIVAGALVVAAWAFAALRQSEDSWVRHSLAARNQIAKVMALLQRAESGQRGYLLTSRDTYLESYGAAVQGLPAALSRLKSLVADNSSQATAVAHMQQLAGDKVDELRATISAHKAGHPDQALAIVNSDTGKQAMDQLRAVAALMEREEDRLLERRQSVAATFGLLLEIGAAAALLLICVAGALASILTRRSFNELATAHDQLVATNQELMQQVNRREAAESQLRQAHKMEAIGQLSGGIAHDFNNMLGVISGSLELMQRRIKNGDFQIERFIEAALHAAKRSAVLTHRLLAFARRQPLSPAPLDANRMIASMSDLLRSTLGEHIRIETVTAGGLWTTKADPHQLENAILNIAINARDAMPEGGNLTIETANAYLDEAYAREHTDVEPGQFVLVAVTDTGTGMVPDVIARAFDPFFTTKAIGTGTGLGLSQVYGFVKQSNGHIKIYSEVGAGTTVKIYLPRYIGDAKQAERSPAGPLPGGRSDEVVLVVEDDAMVRRTTAEGLRELGYSVIETDGALAALAVLEGRSDIALLLTDVVMPEVDGKKLADEALRRRSDLKVLFTTGYTANAVVHGGILDPGVQFLAKPFALEQLANKVRNVLDG